MEEFTQNGECAHHHTGACNYVFKRDFYPMEGSPRLGNKGGLSLPWHCISNGYKMSQLI